MTPRALRRQYEQARIAEGWKAAAFWQQRSGDLGEQLREAEKERDYWEVQHQAQVDIICGKGGDDSEPETMVVIIP